MRHVQPSVSRDGALERLNRGWGARLGRWRAMVGRALGNGELPRLELIWMPSYLVTIRLESRQGESEVTCNVDGCSGSFAIFQMHESIRGGDVRGEDFAAAYDEAAAEKVAREELVKTILRRRSRAGKPIPKETVRIELLRYPYWVYYYRRRPRFIDIKVLDAATGRPVGNKIKLGILDAFKAAARQSGLLSTEKG